MSIDRLSNMLSSLKNAAMAGNTVIETFHSKELESVAKVLKDRGFITEVKTFKEKGKPYKMLHLELALEDGTVKLSNIKRISKPGRRVYKRYDQLKSVAGGYGLSIVSTSRGIMEGNDAKRKKLGGEVICEVL